MAKAIEKIKMSKLDAADFNAEQDYTRGKQRLVRSDGYAQGYPGREKMTASETDTARVTAKRLRMKKNAKSASRYSGAKNIFDLMRGGTL
jgi:hypothetical protein